ncbi:MAG: CcmD family protein [Chloroflexota bacterium]
MEGSLVFLFAALAIIWLAIIGYLVLLGSRLTTLQRELEAMRQHTHEPSEHEPDAR